MIPILSPLVRAAQSAALQTSRWLDQAVAKNAPTYGVKIVNSRQVLHSHELAIYPPAVQRALLIVRGLSSEQLLEATRDQTSDSYLELLAQLGPGSESGWIVRLCAQESCDQELISHRELAEIEDATGEDDQL